MKKTCEQIMNPADEAVLGVPLFEFRAVTQAIYTLSHSLDPVGTEPASKADPAFSYLYQSENLFYHWMKIIAGHAGLVLAAEIYRDIHLAYTESEEPTFQTPDNSLPELCARLELHYRLLTRFLTAHCQLNNKQPPPPPRKYRVALSFAGEKRAVVSQVADMLSLRFSESQVLYDNYHTHVWAQPNLDIILPPLYRTESDLIVVLSCQNYVEKEWCGLEMRQVRTLIKEKQGHRIMLLKFDNADVEGFESIDGFINIKDMTPLEVTRKILARYDHNLIQELKQDGSK